MIGAVSLLRAGVVRRRAARALARRTTAEVLAETAQARLDMARQDWREIRAIRAALVGEVMREGIWRS